MTWTYSSDPSSSEKDAVRFEVQDTDINAQLLQDEEIAYALAQEPGVLGAAARCCEALARRFAAQADTTVGSLKKTNSTAAEGYAERARELRARAVASTSAPWTGGTSITRKDGLADDDDRVQPRFHRGQFVNW